jgi:hypothetical protein
VAAELAQGRTILLDRCINVSHTGKSLPGSSLPDNVVATIVEQMSCLDPQADVQLALACPACKYEWEAAFDIASFFWKELQSAGHKILREIHVLASAYGWSEAQILSMSGWRRQAYLALQAD